MNMTDEEMKRFEENHEKLKQDIAWLRKYIKIYNTQDFLNEDIVIQDMEENSTYIMNVSHRLK